ncbi:FAD-binding PCMH-type domain-containing protein [Pseudozyma hubeiensis]|nr:FAD-binding PCMH-type domain-containing protein [Pseudozyma hubeiensis]
MLTTTLASGFGTATAAPLSSGAAACSSLSTNPSITVLTPSSDPSSYSSAKTSGFNPLNNKLSPSCIVQPTATADVSTIMKAIFTSNSAFAVRSGGHTGMAGWDSVEGGVLIDFSKMTGFAFDAGAGTVSVEPGLRWGDVYNLSAVHGVAPMGGRVSHVGTGLILGGGLSLLSPLYGYACDGLVEAEIVSPEGNVLTVNKDTNPTLLRAIKGGGGRFGVVTKYTLRAFPTGTNDEKNWYGGSITSLDPLGMDAMVSLTEKFVATPDDPKATLLSNVGLLKIQGVPTWLGSTFLFYKGTKEEFDCVFRDFLAIPAAIVDVKPLSYLEAAATTPLGWTSTQAYKWMGGSLYPNASLTARPLPSVVPAIPIVNVDAPSTYLALWNNLKPFLAKHADVIGSAFFSITPVRTNQIEQGYLAGSNAISPPRGRSYMHWLFSTILEENTDSFPEDLERDRLQLIRDNPSDRGLPLFLNEVDASQNAFKTYGWYEELKQEYRNFDPSGFSVKHQQGPKF